VHAGGDDRSPLAGLSGCLMFLNIQIHLIILKTHDQQFTLTAKKSLHIIFNATKFG